MEVVNEDLSSTDVNSDSEDRKGYISLTDVNSDSNSSCVVVAGDSASPEKQKQSPSLFLSENSSVRIKKLHSRTQHSDRHSRTKKVKGVKKSSAVMAGDQKSLVCRRDFISDSSSDEELPVMDSLRDRLARKRQNIVASRLLHEDALDRCLGQSSDADVNVQGLTDPARKLTTDPPNFSESSEDEADRQPLSSFLSSPTTTHHNGTRSPSPESISKSMIPSNCAILDYKSIERTSHSNQSSHVVMEEETDTKKVGGKTKSNSSAAPGAKRKRTAEEVEENKRIAQEKKAERDRLKQAKEAEKQKRKIERESKKQFSLGSCLKFVKVMVDTNIMNTPGFGAVIFKACEELGVTCVTEQLVIPYTIMWKREVTECNMSSDIQVETVHSEIIENEVLALIPTADFVQMVYNFKQKQKGTPVEGVTLRSYVRTVNSHLRDKTVTLVVQGIEQYFRDLKTQGKRQHREAVLSTDPNYVPTKGKKEKARMLQVSRVDIEEAVTDTQLQTGCCTGMLETQEEVADLLRRFSKAVAERPAKPLCLYLLHQGDCYSQFSVASDKAAIKKSAVRKDRFDPIFSFHEEGSAGVKVDRSGHGLLKVWKQQLLQFKNVSPDVAQALIAAYPSPQLLRQAYLKCSNEKEAVRLLENIVVRRGAGVLETSRRIGKELSRRIYTFLTSDDPNLVIK